MTDQTPRAVKHFPPMTDHDKEIARTMFNRQPDGAPFGDATDPTPRPGELTDAEVISEFVSTLIGSYINPDATERTRLERDSQAHRAELLRRLARVPPADTVTISRESKAIIARTIVSMHGSHPGRVADAILAALGAEHD